jgi:hypothetical protein
MTRRLPLVLVMIVVTALLTLGVACKTAQANDSQVVSQVQSKLYADPTIQSKQIAVQSKDGVVTLSGSVASDAERTAAASAAATADGVKTVVNNLTVAQPQTAADDSASAPEPIPTSKPRASRSAAPRRMPTSYRHSEPAPVTAQVTPPPVAQAPAEPVQAATPPPPPPPPAPKKVTIDTGTTVSVRLAEGVNSETAQQGQTFRATLDAPLTVDGEVAIPAGYDVEGHVVDVKSAGKFAGQSALALQLDRIVVGTKTYNIHTSQYQRRGNNRTTNTAKKVGAGAAIGAIIGGIAGGGKGAAIGAAAGGGLGGGVQAATKGQQIDLPTETVLTFELQSPLTVIPTTRGPNAGRHKLEDPNAPPPNE